MSRVQRKMDGLKFALIGILAVVGVVYIVNLTSDIPDYSANDAQIASIEQSIDASSSAYSNDTNSNRHRVAYTPGETQRNANNKPASASQIEADDHRNNPFYTGSDSYPATPRSDSGPAGLNTRQRTTAGRSDNDARIPELDEETSLSGSKRESEVQEESEVASVDQDKQISGRVLNSDGFPLGSIELVATANRIFGLSPGQTIPAGMRRNHTVSDSSGAYQISGLAGGEYTVRTLATDNYTASYISVRTGVDFADLVVTGQRRIKIFGQISGNDGMPIEGVRVSPTVRGQHGVFSDASGVYELDFLLGNNSRGFSVRARHDSFREKQIHLQEAQINQQSLQLPIVMELIVSRTRLSGVVIDTDNNPLRGSVVKLYSQTLRQNYRTTTDQLGHFELSNIETSNDYALTVSAAGSYQIFEQQNLNLAEEGLALSVVLEASDSSTVFGRIVDQNGNPVPNFNMTLRRHDAPYQSRPVISDVDGSFLIADAPTGALVIETQAYPRFLISGVTAQPGGHHEVPVIIDWGNNELRGSVIDANGVPVSAPNVTLTWSQTKNGIRSWANRRTAADSQGYFLFSGLGPGPHKVIVSAPGYRQVQIDHDVLTQGFEMVVQLGD